MVFAIYFFSILSAVAAVVTIIMHWKEQMVSKLLFKTIASISFVLCGVFSLSNKIFGTWQILIVVGLLFGLIGDIFLSVVIKDEKDKRLFDLFGLLFFLAGHLCYIGSFFKLSPEFNIYLIVFPIVLPLAIILLFASKFFKANVTDKITCTIYAVVLGAMLSFAINVLLKFPGEQFAIFLVVGASLFVLSDVMRSFKMFAVKQSKIYPLFLACYYAGQILIALSIGFKQF